MPVLFWPSLRWSQLNKSFRFKRTETVFRFVLFRKNQFIRLESFTRRHRKENLVLESGLLLRFHRLMKIALTFFTLGKVQMQSNCFGQRGR